MSEYQVLARKYRPQKFGEIVGQEAIVRTLQNAIKQGRIAHAYLFSGPRGTGKTTTARILAKALNCQSPIDGFEPCNACPSCKEITQGHSLDVLEIDGASHRGIEDIRKINETAGYSASSGKYKIYIIDEVHMLTKEAFNALLKTLEEPPPHVKFLFATTEPHKVLPTIISRCQRFQLNRIDTGAILKKLKEIAQDLSIQIEDGALRTIANMSEGGLRDAESLFDQVIAFHEGAITQASVASILGMPTSETYFELDRAGKEGQLAKAFEITERIFSQGTDLGHFLEGLINHFRTLLIINLSGQETTYLTLLESEKPLYTEAASLYSKEQCVALLEMLLEAQQTLRFAPSPRTALETLLLKIIRVRQRLPVDLLVRRLSELESAIMKGTPLIAPVVQQQVVQKPTPLPPESLLPKATLQVTEDPTPHANEIPKTAPKKKLESEPEPVAKPQSPKEEITPLDAQTRNRYDTLLQFAAVELEGTIKRNE